MFVNKNIFFALILTEAYHCCKLVDTKLIVNQQIISIMPCPIISEQKLITIELLHHKSF